MLVSKERADDLERLTELIEAGSVSPSVDSTYLLADAADAMRRLEAGSVGKGRHHSLKIPPVSMREISVTLVKNVGR